VNIVNKNSTLRQLPSAAALAASYPPAFLLLSLLPLPPSTPSYSANTKNRPQLHTLTHTTPTSHSCPACGTTTTTTATAYVCMYSTYRTSSWFLSPEGGYQDRDRRIDDAVLVEKRGGVEGLRWSSLLRERVGWVGWLAAVCQCHRGRRGRRWGVIFW
jgi:hypothetical protein